MRFLGVFALAALCSGCVTEANQNTTSYASTTAPGLTEQAEANVTPGQNPDEIIFSRVDCFRASDGPQYQTDFELAKAVCVPQAQASGVAAAAGVPTGRGWAGAIVSGIESG